jgi:hypothetical protein
MMREMPKYSKTNTTSQSTLRTIKKKLQGKCTTCGGTLPDHIGTCPVWGEELIRRYDEVDIKVEHISTVVQRVVDNLEAERNV